MRRAEVPANGKGAASGSRHGGADVSVSTATEVATRKALCRERAIVIQGSQGPIIGVLAQPAGDCHAALLIVPGQPQTRVGAHRMFTELARGLAERGVASLRFDIGGWGDSPGEPLPFEKSANDIAAAAAFLHKAISPAPSLWLWGLCDGASAAVLALPMLRAAGVAPQVLCLVNPWVRSEKSLASAMVKTYYAKRLMEREFWMRLFTGKIPLANLVDEPLRHLRARFRRPHHDGRETKQASRTPGQTADPRAAEPETAAGTADLPEQLLAQLAGFRGEVLTVLSGNDLTAGETDALLSADKRWRKRLDRKAALLRVPGADHTFSDPEHWNTVVRWCAAKARDRISPERPQG